MVVNDQSAPHLVEITADVVAVAAQGLAAGHRVRELRHADRSSNQALKRIAAATKFPAGTRPYYRAGFEWRNRKAYQLEQDLLEQLAAVLAGSVVVLGSAEYTDALDQVIGWHLSADWSQTPSEVEIITKSLGPENAVHLAAALDAGARFFKPLTNPS